LGGEDELGSNSLSGDDDSNGILLNDSKAQGRGGYTSSEDPNRTGNPERGFGRLAHQTFHITAENVDAIERHLSKPLFLEDDGSIAPANARMIARLRKALAEGRPIAEADASFYFHELYEADLMDNAGLDYKIAHRIALDYYDVADFTVYHSDVVQELRGKFGSTWSTFWGIGGE